jgi:hypothetical protein
MTRDVSITKEQARYEGCLPLLSFFHQPFIDAFSSRAPGAAIGISVGQPGHEYRLSRVDLVHRHVLSCLACYGKHRMWLYPVRSLMLYQATATIWSTMIALVAFMAEVWLFVIRASRIDAEIERREKAARKKAIR